jgi:hypothetical protein
MSEPRRIDVLKVARHAGRCAEDYLKSIDKSDFRELSQDEWDRFCVVFLGAGGRAMIDASIAALETVEGPLTLAEAPF